jgi:hypothetical protein
MSAAASGQPLVGLWDTYPASYGLRVVFIDYFTHIGRRYSQLAGI